MIENLQGEQFQPSWQLKCIFAVIGLLNFAAALDATSLSVALPRISDDLGGTAIQAFWSGTSFLVTSTVSQPIFCLTSDIFGRKSVLFTALVAFTIGSILAAVCKTFTLMLVGRSIQGIGGGGIMSLTEVLIADLIPLRERGKWMSVRSATWALGTVLGPIIGGSFSQSQWRWIFWINLPFCGLGLILIPIFLRLEWQPRPLRERLAQRTLVPLLIGVAGLIGFVLYEHYIPAHPLIPSAIFFNYSSSLNFFGCFLHGVILWALLYYLPLYYEGSLGYSAVITGVAIFPETFTVAPVSVIVGLVIAHKGRYRWALWGGWSITTLGLGILNLLDVNTSVPKLIFLNLVPGIGLGMLFSSMILAVQASANPDFLSITVTMTPFFRTLGQAVGVAIGGVVFQNRIRAEFDSHPELWPGVTSGAASLAQDASALVQYIKTIPVSDPRRHRFETVYADALSTVWAVLCGIAGLGLLSSVFVKAYPMNQAFTSRQGVKKSSSSSSGTELEKGNA